MFTTVGKKKLAGQIGLLVVNIVVLALSANVNQFQGFFYAADIFPLALSIITLVVLCSLLTLDLALDNAYSGRPQSEIAIFGLFSLLWLSINIFSTKRWSDVPFQCNSIPADFADERTWCKALQALKSFVWIEFVICISITLLTLRYALSQYYRGNKHIFSGPLSRYSPRAPSEDNMYLYGGRSSEFLQFEKVGF